MKISNWRKKISAALLAGGLLTPAAAQAYNIPVADPSFEDFVVPASPPSAGYAYAGIVPIHYRPTSAWISKPDGGNFQDGGPNGSNWIYNSSYAESASATTHRASPRTGNQAMHGRGLVSGQEVGAVFQAGSTYTFSIYAQGDDDALLLGQPFGWQSRAYLYIYDGGPPFDETTALTYDPTQYDTGSPNFTYWPKDRFAPSEPVPPDGATTHTGNFINRPVGATAAQSKADWQQISVSLFVAPGDPEIGHPIGVAFKVIDDGAVDDASLSAIGPGDLNLDGAINAADWGILRTNQFANLTGKTPLQAYQLGDLNGDLKNDQADFIVFKNSYIDVHGAAAFAALAGVPEPSTVAIVFSGGALVWLGRQRAKTHAS